MEREGDKSQANIDRIDGVERELRGLRNVFEKIYSLLWWSAVLLFAIVVTLIFWLLSGLNVDFAIKADSVLIVVMAVAFVLFQCLKWLFADVSSNSLRAEMDFARPASSVEEQLGLVPATTPTSGT